MVKTELEKQASKFAALLQTNADAFRGCGPCHEAIQAIRPIVLKFARCGKIQTVSTSSPVNQMLSAQSLACERLDFRPGAVSKRRGLSFRSQIGR